MSESGSSPADLAGAADFAAGNLDKLTDEIGSADAFDRNDIHDPNEMLDYKRQKIEADHEGLRGLISPGVGWIFRQPSYDEKMRELDNAARYSAESDARGSAELSAQQQRGVLQQMQAKLRAALSGETMTELQRSGVAVEQDYRDRLQSADQIASGHTYFSQGFNPTTLSRPRRDAATQLAEADPLGL
jgi:hypothetical protein